MKELVMMERDQRPEDYETRCVGCYTFAYQCNFRGMRLDEGFVCDECLLFMAGGFRWPYRLRVA